MALKIGICGVGQFGAQFVELFQAHPAVGEVVLADERADRLAEIAAGHGIRRTCRSLDELCAGDVDAIAIFTQRWRHAPQAVRALRAGKHVYSAVPAAVTLEELAELVETVEATGLCYMLGETSYYRPQTIYCRRRFAAGDFGRFVYGEGQYHHDMAHFYLPYMVTNGPEWRRYASFPPMLYPTHSVAHILSVTFRRMTEVACFGFTDDHADGIFNERLSAWGNVFSNETALFRTSDGGAARINEFRRTGAGESRMTIIGTRGAYEEQASPGHLDRIIEAMQNGKARPGAASSAVWTALEFGTEMINGEFDYASAHQRTRRHAEDLTSLHQLDGVEITEANLGALPREYLGRRHLGVSWIHPVERLPAGFVGRRNGHCGSHQFLVVDFIEALTTGSLPPNHVWAAARYNAPGIVAHESARRGGELLKIPDFGRPPADAPLLDPLAALRD